MRNLQLIIADTLEAIDGPTEELTPELVDEVLRPAKENMQKVIQSASMIEHILEDIIRFYFFGNDSGTKEAREKFVSLILTTDWFSFGIKRKLMEQIINDKELITGNEKNKYFKLLHQTIATRNAFVHGTFSTDGRVVKLSYYQGAPKEQMLSEIYLSSTEAILNECFQISQQLAFAIGAYTVHADEPH